MFDEFLRNCPMEDGIKPSKKRVSKNISALNSLIGTEAGAMTKRSSKAKRLVAVAVISVVSMFLLLTAVNAATEGGVVKFIMGGKEIEGDYDDYVDHAGFRHITFNAVLPIDENNFAVIYDVDKPWGENVRVITEETDPDFMERLRLFIAQRHDPERQPEDFGLIFKDNEFCTYEWKNDDGTCGGGGTIGGNFLHTETTYGKPNGYIGEFNYDHENGTKNLKETIYYYVGKD